MAPYSRRDVTPDEVQARLTRTQDRWRSNRAVGIILTVLIGAFLARTLFFDWVYREMSDGFTLGVFPVAGLLAMMACTLGLILDSRHHGVEDSLRGITWKSWGYCVLLVVGCYAYFLLWEPVGFLPISAVLLCILIYLLGARPRSSAVLAGVVVWLGMYGIFRALGVELPAGPLSF